MVLKFYILGSLKHDPYGILMIEEQVNSLGPIKNVSKKIILLSQKLLIWYIEKIISWKLKTLH